jgi:hypothetical protein
LIDGGGVFSARLRRGEHQNEASLAHRREAPPSTASP